jgi:hypothetical protein
VSVGAGVSLGSGVIVIVGGGGVTVPAKVTRVGEPAGVGEEEPDPSPTAHEIIKGMISKQVKNGLKSIRQLYTEPGFIPRWRA